MPITQQIQHTLYIYIQYKSEYDIIFKNYELVLLILFSVDLYAKNHNIRKMFRIADKIIKKFVSYLQNQKLKLIDCVQLDFFWLFQR